MPTRTAARLEVSHASRSVSCGHIADFCAEIADFCVITSPSSALQHKQHHVCTCRTACRHLSPTVTNRTLRHVHAPHQSGAAALVAAPEWSGPGRGAAGRDSAANQRVLRFMAHQDAPAPSEGPAPSPVASRHGRAAGCSCPPIRGPAPSPVPSPCAETGATAGQRAARVPPLAGVTWATRAAKRSVLSVSCADAAAGDTAASTSALPSPLRHGCARARLGRGAVSGAGGGGWGGAKAAASDHGCGSWAGLGSGLSRSPPPPPTRLSSRSLRQ